MKRSSLMAARCPRLLIRCSVPIVVTERAGGARLDPVVGGTTACSRGTRALVEPQLSASIGTTPEEQFPAIVVNLPADHTAESVNAAAIKAF
jgi:hypothetical protein